MSGVSHHSWVAARRHNKSRLHLDMNSLSLNDAAEKLRSWLVWNRIETLNVAGSRESTDAGIHDAVIRLLEGALNNSFSK
ncbi:YpsA SLOG family protein [Thermodesulfobacteriota bacterium]